MSDTPVASRVYELPKLEVVTDPTTSFLVDTPTETFRLTYEDLTSNLPVPSGVAGMISDALSTIDVSGDIAAAIAALLSNPQVVSAYWQMLGQTYKRIDLGNVSGNVNIDLSLGMYFTMTVVGNITIAFSNPRTGTIASHVGLKITNTGLYTVSFQTGTNWPSSTPPGLDDIGVYILNFLTDDNGATWNNIGQALALGH